MIVRRIFSENRLRPDRGRGHAFRDHALLIVMMAVRMAMMVVPMVMVVVGVIGRMR